MATGYGDLSWLRSEGREPGARRKKIGGYLKVANEIRQSYFNPDGTRLGSRDLSDDSGVEGPGAFPDAAIVRGDNEEMMVFPSYARNHVKRKSAPPPATGGQTEQEYWRREWERHQDDKAIVDVDVKGWIYTPHRGPATRKHRLMLGVVRQFVGLPAAATSSTTDPAYLSQASSRASSPGPTWKQDEDSIAREVEHIARKGEKEKRYARRGAFSEAAYRDNDGDSVHSVPSGASSREPSPERGRHRLSEVSLASSTEGDADIPKPLQKRSSTLDPAKMTSAELATANTHLFNRLRPFMANAIPNAPISAFFYNETHSRQHTVHTNANGHFTCRAALEFIPTHVRVLASEKLSATEEVTVTSPTGVSLISDIDDTIKHSGISTTAREIFRNTFVRELSDLTIDGVREWYNTMHDMGVTMHYVSNSPWQLYPVLTSYFKLAHLPKGSFHLKQYSGMLQGIFEPVAERKKSSLEKIMRDFPDRKFVLVGDSGEADLEVYTDVAIENPGRVLAIFIRDVTTSVKTGYFDPSNGMSGDSGRGRASSQRRSDDSLAMSKQSMRNDATRDEDADLKAAIAASLADIEGQTQSAQNLIEPDSPSRVEDKKRPTLPPPRRSTPRAVAEKPPMPQPEEDLIDFSEEPTPSQDRLRVPSNEYTQPEIMNGAPRQKLSPAPPPKPAKLRSPSPSGQNRSTTIESPSKPPPPPRPRKPSTSVHPSSLQQIHKPIAQVPPAVAALHQPSPLSQVTLSSTDAKERPPLPVRSSHLSALSRGFSRHNTDLSPSSKYKESDITASQPRPTTPGPVQISPRAMSTLSTRSQETMRPVSSSTVKATPPPPPRLRTATWNASSAASRKASNRVSGEWKDSDDRDLPRTPKEAGVPTKEFMWSQRWARAKRVLERDGVTLKSWRVGSDVADICVRLVEQALRDLEKEGAKQQL